MPIASNVSHILAAPVFRQIIFSQTRQLFMFLHVCIHKHYLVLSLHSEMVYHVFNLFYQHIQINPLYVISIILFRIYAIHIIIISYFTLFLSFIQHENFKNNYYLYLLVLPPPHISPIKTFFMCADVFSSISSVF